MKTRTLSQIFIMTVLLTGLALPAQRVHAEDFYPDVVYSREELAQMLAPIALYPDALLSQVLMAATYPIEVIEADRWLRANPHLQGEYLDYTLAAEVWDPSVKALCHFPSILALMSERIGETTDLGNAFLGQEDEVMGMVQELRAAAYAQGHLYTTAQQRVIAEQQTIIIEPTTRVIYVPYYDPLTIYGPWWYPAYPPWYWSPPGVHIGFGIAYWPGIHFNFSFVSWSRFDWHRRHIHVDVHKRPRYVRHDHWVKKPGRWQHAPVHRRGVAYRDRSTAQKYGHPSRVAHFRRDVRNIPVRGDRNLNRHPGEHGRQTVGRRTERPRYAPGRQQWPRVEKSQTTRDKQLRGLPDRNRRQPGREEPGRSVRNRPEPKKQQVRTNRHIREQRKTTRKRQTGTGTKHARTPRYDREQARSERKPVVGNLPRQRRTDWTAPRPKVERRQTQTSRNDVSNRKDTGPREHLSREDIRPDRQDRDRGFAARNNAAGENRGRRFDRGGFGR